VKVVFFGGGGFRTLPIARSAMAQRKIVDKGELHIYDLDAARAEAMARMIQKTPEYRAVDCKVTWGTSLARALDGADAVAVSMMALPRDTFGLCNLASRRYGILSSDQISPTGAFLAIKHGTIVHQCAREMETHCPGATLIVFCNPVPVVSGVVSLHTKIRALGVCGGYTNHMWDLTRLLGRDEPCNRYDVDVAGINHLSFILRGSLDGRDLYQEVLAERLGPGWKPPRFSAATRPASRPHIRFGVCKLREMFHQFGTVIFSTEGDGMTHLFYEEMYARHLKYSPKPTVARIKADARRGLKQREEADRQFQALAREDVDDAYWATQDRDDDGITVRILGALAGTRPVKIVTSYPNRGAVAGFKDRTILEYSQQLSARAFRPVKNLAVPDPFHGLITSLATHQTLMADAIATGDPQIFYEAMFTYPVQFNTKAARSLWKDLVEINKAWLPPSLQQVRKLL